jgi:hypothetical protein
MMTLISWATKFVLMASRNRRKRTSAPWRQEVCYCIAIELIGANRKYQVLLSYVKCVNSYGSNAVSKKEKVAAGVLGGKD